MKGASPKETNAERPHSREGRGIVKVRDISVLSQRCAQMSWLTCLKVLTMLEREARARCHEPVFQSHGLVSSSADEAWLHWRIQVPDDHRAGKMVVNLTGRLDECGAISPRVDEQLKDLEKWQHKLLPFRQFGFIVLTTSAGVMDHEEARQKHTGGEILGSFL